jgi:diadenosine tetraphosphate (Ap4A) HIT family hydrolase
VSLDHLWAGWRASYVGSAGTGGAVSTSVLVEDPGSCESVSGRQERADGTSSVSPVPAGALPNASAPDEGDCAFCAILASGGSEEQRNVVWAGETMVAMLNAYPYSSGHLLVMPQRHVRELEDLTSEEAAGLWQAVHRGVAALKAAYLPDGLNLGLNLGRAAGAGIPGHLHVHIVPRWLGDTNFMTTAAGVRVLPEALGVTWQRLRAAWV